MLPHDCIVWQTIKNLPSYFLLPHDCIVWQIILNISHAMQSRGSCGQQNSDSVDGTTEFRFCRQDNRVPTLFIYLTKRNWNSVRPSRNKEW